MDAIDEIALVRRCQDGDAKAFTALVTLYERVVYTLALRMTGDREDARDISQIVFMKVFKGLSGFDPRRRFFSWIYRIAVNESIDRLRGRRPADPLDPQLASNDAPEAAAERSERASQVQGAMLDLNEDDRQLLVLRHWLDRSYAEIGEALGIQETTVKSRLFEARQRLGRALRRRGVNEA
jgi:RNA polymerase sigma-70 factor (ECF subfamily)